MLMKQSTCAQIPVVSAEVRAFLESLTPGESIDLVPNPTGDHSFDVRRTSLLEIAPRRELAVSQSHRKVANTPEPRTIEATVLRHDRQSNQHTHLGIYTTMKEFLDSFHLVGGSAGALRLEWVRAVYQAHLRSSFHRLVPHSRTPPVALLRDDRKKCDIGVELVDLATGGASLSYRDASGTLPLFGGGETICFSSRGLA